MRFSIKNITETIGIIILVQRYGLNNKKLLVLLCVFACKITTISQENLTIQNKGIYDTLTNKYVYSFVEEMPKYNGGYQNFWTDFRENFKYPENTDSINQWTFHILFVIDEDGNLTGQRIRNKKENDLTEIEKVILKTIGVLQNWQSAKHENKSVSVILSIPLRITWQ
jgi:hypothetical protein